MSQEIAIWGTGQWAEHTFEVAKRYGWDVGAMIDNDEGKAGKQFHGIPIYMPDEFKKKGKKMPILVGCKSEEVDKQAQLYSDLVIPHEAVKGIFSAGQERYPMTELENENLEGCEVVTDRIALLHKFSFPENTAVMAEIGVAFGEFSEQILKICNPQKLILIDAWESKDYADGLETVKKKFEDEISRGIVEIYRGYSTEKLPELEDNSLDWAYIDTVHDFDITMQELLLCDKKVKKYGYICGHDFAKFNTLGGVYYGVYDAVCKFVKENKYRFCYLTLESHVKFLLAKIVERITYG